MIWGTMQQRCLNPKSKAYHRYGGRGITICDRWLDFTRFQEDMEPTWKDGLSIERIDVNGNYEPSNCKWIPVGDQWKNKRPWKEWRKPEMLVTNTSGIKGVYWSKRDRRWCAAISIKNKTHYLGSFVSKDDAAEAYRSAAIKRTS